jgi:hypothetical protein
MARAAGDTLDDAVEALVLLVVALDVEVSVGAVALVGLELAGVEVGASACSGAKAGTGAGDDVLGAAGVLGATDVLVAAGVLVAADDETDVDVLVRTGGVVAGASGASEGVTGGTLLGVGVTGSGAAFDGPGAALDGSGARSVTVGPGTTDGAAVADAAVEGGAEDGAAVDGATVDGAGEGAAAVGAAAVDCTAGAGRSAVTVVAGADEPSPGAASAVGIPLANAVNDTVTADASAAATRLSRDVRIVGRLLMARALPSPPTLALEPPSRLRFTRTIARARDSLHARARGRDRGEQCPRVVLLR